MNVSPSSRGKLKLERKGAKWKNVNGRVIVIELMRGSDALSLGTRQDAMMIMRGLILGVMIDLGTVMRTGNGSLSVKMRFRVLLLRKFLRRPRFLFQQHLNLRLLLRLISKTCRQLSVQRI